MLIYNTKFGHKDNKNRAFSNIKVMIFIVMYPNWKTRKMKAKQDSF